MRIDPTGLLPHQPKAAQHLLSALLKHGAALDASEMGVGKTAHAVAVLRALDDAALVVCPRVSVAGWERMGRHLKTEFDAKHYEFLRGGNSPFGWWDNPMPTVRPREYKCARCQRRVDPNDLSDFCQYPKPNSTHELVSKCVPHARGRFNWHPAIKTLVFDEAHRCSALKSLQADLLIAARRQRIKTLVLSATIAESPLHFRALGYLLGLHNLADARDGCGPIGFYQWAFRHGCQKLPMRGLQFTAGAARKQEILHALHSELFPERGCRVRIDSLGDSFPEVQITAELYNCEAANRINVLYGRMRDSVDRINVKRAGDVVALTEILRDRQEVEMLMLPVFVELAQDAVIEGRHVALFFNFRDTVEECCKMLKTTCRVDGSQSGDAGAKRRMACVDAFQRDEEPYIVCTNDAGAESIDLHDVRGEFGRLGLVSLGWSAKKTRQVFGRLRRALGKSKAIYRCVLAAGTVQERVHKACAGKLDRIDTLNDADLMADNLPLTQFPEDEIHEITKRFT